MAEVRQRAGGPKQPARSWAAGDTRTARRPNSLGTRRQKGRLKDQCDITGARPARSIVDHEGIRSIHPDVNLMSEVEEDDVRSGTATKA